MKINITVFREDPFIKPVTVNPAGNFLQFHSGKGGRDKFQGRQMALIPGDLVGTAHNFGTNAVSDISNYKVPAPPTILNPSFSFA